MVNLRYWILEIHDGLVSFEFFRNPASRNVFPYERSSIPLAQKGNIISNEIDRIKQRCSSAASSCSAVKNFGEELLQRGYDREFIHRNEERKPRTTSAPMQQNRHFLHFPYVGEKVDHQLKRAIKRSGFGVNIFRRNKTLRMMLKGSSPAICDRQCNIDRCQQQKVVYMFDCQCGASYCGSTKRTLHT